MCLGKSTESPAKSTGLGIDVPLWPSHHPTNYWGWFFVQQIFQGDVKPITKTGHQSQALMVHKDSPFLDYYCIMITNILAVIISNRYLKVMFKIPKTGHLPTPVHISIVLPSPQSPQPSPTSSSSG